MRTLIENSQTGQYVSENGWTSDRFEAMSFRSSLQALDYCCRNQLRDVILVLTFSDPQFDLELHPFSRPRRKRTNKATPRQLAESKAAEPGA